MLTFFFSLVADITLPRNPICLCGHLLTPKKADECYRKSYKCVDCDLCDKRIEKNVDVFHCTNEFVTQHRRGQLVVVFIYYSQKKVLISDVSMLENVSFCHF
jgi:hypothetical protein